MDHTTKAGLNNSANLSRKAGAERSLRETKVTNATTTADQPAASSTAFAIIAALSFCHMLNDMMQSLLAGIYPILKEGYALDFGQIGLMTLTFQITASLLQPLVASIPTNVRSPIR